jgi:hypothetical protein
MTRNGRLYEHDTGGHLTTAEIVGEARRAAGVEANEEQPRPYPSDPAGRSAAVL